MTTPCPTPNHPRYATPEAAKIAATRTGLRLRTYDCVCTWWHLSLSARPQVPATADPAHIQHLANLDDTAFREIVTLDARGEANPLHSAGLRDHINASRWCKTVGQLLHDIEEQLHKRRNERGPDSALWRKRAATYRGVLTLRRAESLRLRTEAVEARARVGQAASAVRTEAADLRRQAGEVAVDRLIAAHGTEFAQYLVEACRELGISAPDRVQRYLPTRD
ncbi:hypothetical protein [Streptomyces xanthophaeus]|uniref:hypothetical protein n=1 Tax=Streptomyces xanthophaeus TaxID=67385 RepID=UPI0036576765